MPKGLTRISLHKGTGTLFDHLLVTSLNRTLTLSDMNGFTFAIAKDLDLDVMTDRIIAFEEHAGVFKQNIAPRFNLNLTPAQFLKTVANHQTHTTATGC